MINHKLKQQLLLQEACLQHYTAAINLAVHLFRIFGKTNALNLGTTFNDHRRSFHLQILNDCDSITIKKFCTIAITCHIIGLSYFIYRMELIRTVWTNVKRSIKISVFTATLGALWKFAHM